MGGKGRQDSAASEASFGKYGEILTGFFRTGGLDCCFPKEVDDVVDEIGTDSSSLSVEQKSLGTSLREESEDSSRMNCSMLIEGVTDSDDSTSVFFFFFVFDCEKYFDVASSRAVTPGESLVSEKPYQRTAGLSRPLSYQKVADALCLPARFSSSDSSPHSSPHVPSPFTAITWLPMNGALD